MAPRARRVYPNTQVNPNSVVREPLANSSANNNLQGPKKRTFATADPIASASASTAAHGATGPPNKKARNTGPSHGRPMQLRSMSERSTEAEQGKRATIDSTQGKGKKTTALRRTSLFAPAHHATPIPVQLAHPFPVQNLDPALADGENDDIDSDDSVETEREWIDEAQLTELTQRFPSRVSEAMAIERPLWVSSVTPAAAPGGASVVAPGSASVIAPGSASVTVPFSELGYPPLQADGASVAAPGSVNVAFPFAELGYPPSQVDGTSVAAPGSASVAVPLAELGYPPSQVNGTSVATPGSASVAVPLAELGYPSSQGGGGDDAADPSLDPYTGVPQGTWSSETDLIFLGGTTRVMLTHQHPSVRAVIQDGFENMRAYLLLVNSFPDAVALPPVLRDCLISAAAGSQDPLAPDIHQRLHQDELYMGKLCPLPRRRIPIYRAEVKERCVALVRADFLAVGSLPAIAQGVTRQLARYTYTFPMAMNNDPIRAVPMRTKPYRNIRLIQVIRDLYFSGGVNSFAHRYRARFPTFENENGVAVQKVPPVMVALVATALYAAIHEWQTGSHNPTEFSMNAYLDVYNGHIQTLNHIAQNRNGAFHRMMADIYERASMGVEVATAPGVPIAEIDLDQLDD